MRRTATIDYNVAVLYPLLIKEWHPTKNEGVERTLWDVTPGSRLKVWWLCSECEHEWAASIRRRAGKGTGCPKCAEKIRGAKNSRPRQGQSLAEKYPDLAREWHPTANDRGPQDVKPHANYRATWQCPKCGNVWQADIRRRVRGKGRCKRCESLALNHPELLDEWHPTLNKKSPYELTPGSNYRAVWRCSREGHVWKASIHHRTISASGCPECAKSHQSIRQRRPGDRESLADTYPDIAEQWHPTKNVNELGEIMTPHDVGPGSGYRATWICGRGHEWETLVHVRTGGASCPKCRPKASRIETRLFAEMKAIFGEVTRGKHLGRKSIDIYIPKYRIGIEYDGNHWHEDKIDHDKRKSLEP
ncbi:MAG: zinc-ribbon domain-containing protein [Thermodesulfobacteriota bacterium]